MKHGEPLTRVDALVWSFVSNCTGVIRVSDAMRSINKEQDVRVCKQVFNAFSYLARHGRIKRIGYGEYVKS